MDIDAVEQRAGKVSLPVLGEVADSLPNCHAPSGAQAPKFEHDFEPEFFTKSQLKTIDALFETILSTDGLSPCASVARVYQYVDEIVMSSNARTKNLWTDGLTRVNKMARGNCGRDFVVRSGEHQTALLEGLSRNEDQPASQEEKFFLAVKPATIGGYYTSSFGIYKDHRYQGNEALLEFPRCGHPEHPEV